MDPPPAQHRAAAGAGNPARQQHATDVRPAAVLGRVARGHFPSEGLQPRAVQGRAVQKLDAPQLGLVQECLDEAYLNGPSVGRNKKHIMPNDDELPMILDRVYPCHEIVKIDYYLPGCPPSAELIWNALVALVTGDELKLPYEVVKFD
jgi:hypothetical protein